MASRPLSEVFKSKKPIIGMVHLSGKDRQEKINRAAQELAIYAQFGLDGAIFEDYHGDERDLYNSLVATSGFRNRIAKGINCLKNPAWAFAYASEFGAKFIQVDSAVGTPFNYLTPLTFKQYKEEYGNPFILGGVRFKYQKPTGKTLEEEIKKARMICDAIVTTGDGTGIETPLEKLREFKKVMGDYPLIVGAGVTAGNIREQLSIADGAIIGSYFKYNGDTNNAVDPRRVAAIMDAARDIRRQ